MATALTHRFPSMASAMLFSFLVLLLLLEHAAGETRHYKFNIDYHNVTRLCHTRTVLTVSRKFPGPRHGIRQLTTGWSDGPSYITQCPIQTNQSYIYNFTITGQRGTLWWHAHISWLRVSIYGPIIILAKRNESYPFEKPHKEVIIMLGEWFNSDPEAIISQALQTGGGPNVSDAYTINGLPGPLYNCSSKDTYKLEVTPGKTYLLRLINAALNDELFFSIANHRVTVVEGHAIYTKPFETDKLLISPGQTTNVLLKTKPEFPNASFLMAARPYFTGQGTFDNLTTVGILEYEHPSIHKSSKNLTLMQPTLPSINATGSVANFTGKFRSLADAKFPANDTSILGAESHPLHLHGYNFFIVGQGFGNFDPNKDPAKFNLLDPMERNTASVPSGGWIAIRFFADNPGVWFMHCHLDVHTSWGLRMAWIVLDGPGPNQKLQPPPSDLPKC
ncbi:hypothetical protein V6N12_057701 [Hibiscus sabdariffa]|uniref:laccase n=1 Tax=Hibiscus sabdariffa TaxID=183260 RepID=A0ABR2C5X1_9ROSI